MSYSAIIEIVGIKELIEDDFSKFSETIQHFKSKSEQAASEVIKVNKKSVLTIFIFRDHCYVEANQIDTLLGYICSLRIKFFEGTTYFFRSVITEGNLNIKEAKQKTKKEESTSSLYEVRYMVYSDVSIRLYALMERFKGVGIMIDTDKISESQFSAISKYQSFTNFYITDIANKKYLPYTDVSLKSTDELFNNLKEIFSRMNSDRMYSKKLVRFYIPLLINIAKHYDLRKSISTDEFSLENIISKPIVTRNKDVIGFEFFYYTLIAKIFDPHYNDQLRSAGYEEQINKMEKELSKNIWLIELLRNDSKFADIPKEILPNPKRRIALRKISFIVNSA